jgi:ABC-2 type transport system permease protein
MRAVARLLPPSYVFESLRTIVAGGTFPWRSLAAGGALVLVQLLLACWIFARIYRMAVDSGLIARYSAESVS